MPRKHSTPPSAKQLVKNSLLRWRRLLIPTLLIGLVWLVINQVLQFLLEDVLLVAEVWFVIVFSVLVWLYGFSPRKKKLPGLRESFYEGSADFLKQLLVFMTWIVYLIPFMLGAYFVQKFNRIQFSPSNAELVAVNTAWLLFSAVSFYWLVRAWLSPVYAQEMGPVRAVRTSWAQSAGRAWWMSKAVLLTIVVAVIPGIVLSLLFLTPLSTSELAVESILGVSKYVAVAYSTPVLIALAYEMKRYERPTPKS